MRRREFPAALAGAGLVPAAGAPRKMNAAMHVGGDYHSVAGASITSKENLEYNLRHGVKHLTAQMRNGPGAAGWDLDLLKRMREDCDRVGVTLEAIRMEPDYIQKPSEEALAVIAGNIAKAKQVGVKVITYHWTMIPIRRNRKTPGRGGAEYEGFRLEANWQSLPTGAAGKISHDEYWKRITRFLTQMVPVAREHDVRLACHPYDPPGLPFGYQGAENWDAPNIFAAIKRYEAVVDSPYNGFQLCLGTVAEGLKNPARDVLPIVEYLGKKGKIYQVHMRNIKGGLGEFEEVYPDEGVMNFFEVMRILRDSGFAYSICPDHMPHHPNDPKSLQAFAFGYGYIQALIRAVNS